MGRWARALMALAVLGPAAGCRPGAADRCVAPPPWRLVYPKPGQLDAEMWGCLNDAAWEARALKAPLNSKLSGIIAECEVNVDKYEGNALIGSASLSEEDRATAEQRAQQLARAAIAQYQGCEGR